jgi:hypothetical protein
MVSQLRAVGTDMVGGLLWIAIALGGIRRNDEDFSRRAVSVGLCCGLTYSYVYEHDPLAAMLDSFWRRLAFSGLEQLLVQIVIRKRSPSEMLSGLIGLGIGTILYRLVYGVIFDVPPARLRRGLSIFS